MEIGGGVLAAVWVDCVIGECVEVEADPLEVLEPVLAVVDSDAVEASDDDRDEVDVAVLATAVDVTVDSMVN